MTPDLILKTVLYTFYIMVVMMPLLYILHFSEQVREASSSSLLRACMWHGTILALFTAGSFFAMNFVLVGTPDQVVRAFVFAIPISYFGAYGADGVVRAVRMQMLMLKLRGRGPFAVDVLLFGKRPQDTSADEEMKAREILALLDAAERRLLEKELTRTRADRLVLRCSDGCLLLVAEHDLALTQSILPEICFRVALPADGGQVHMAKPSATF